MLTKLTRLIAATACGTALLLASTLITESASAAPLLPEHSPSVIITMTNMETGNSIALRPDVNESGDDNADNRTASVSVTLTEAQLELIAQDDPRTEPVEPQHKMPTADVGGNRSDGVVTARLNINYDINGDKVRINRFYGSITTKYPTNFYEKSLDGGDGYGWSNHSIHKRNIPNTFSYTTGWGYAPRLMGAQAPGGVLTLRFAPDGMAQNRLEVAVKV